MNWEDKFGYNKKQPCMYLGLTVEDQPDHNALKYINII